MLPSSFFYLLINARIGDRHEPREFEIIRRWFVRHGLRDVHDQIHGAPPSSLLCISARRMRKPVVSHGLAGIAPLSESLHGDNCGGATCLSGEPQGILD